jgi:hypothetical protein
MTEIECPICHRKNRTTAAFCVYCGTSLIYDARAEPTTRRIGFESQLSGKTGEKVSIESFQVPEHGIALYVADYVTPIAVREDAAFVIGRKLSDLVSDKFVDLTGFGAYEHGVSHRHAMIRQKIFGYEIMDLDSTNGTEVNERRLRPSVGYPLPSGSLIRLGRLNLYAVYSIVRTKRESHD